MQYVVQSAARRNGAPVTPFGLVWAVGLQLSMLLGSLELILVLLQRLLSAMGLLLQGLEDL